ncbi:MAG: lysophospholipid acyltransferase family protein, partial [Flavobacteriales bacterium]|nr:lysophospholipid acyltransferase family protein [Flavobacteriales bacterium]
MTSRSNITFDGQLYGRWLSVFRILTVVLWVLIGCLFTGLLRLFIRPFSKWYFIRINTLWIVHPWSRGIVWILGMKILIEGKVEPNDQVIVSHHMGLIDSLMVMALSPCMVLSNKDIREIPFVGNLLRFLGFVFLDRRQPRSLIKVIADKREMLRRSRINVAFFPEGFIGDGNEMGAFHSSLFALSESHDVDIQPIVFRCTAINGIPLSFQDASSFLFN